MVTPSIPPGPEGRDLGSTEAHIQPSAEISHSVAGAGCSATAKRERTRVLMKPRPSVKQLPIPQSSLSRRMSTSAPQTPLAHPGTSRHCTSHHIKQRWPPLHSAARRGIYKRCRHHTTCRGHGAQGTAMRSIKHLRLRVLAT